jgi:predicted lipid-binding transport protein (Tim44 family)
MRQHSVDARRALKGGRMAVKTTMWMAAVLTPGLAMATLTPAAAETVMQQCGQQYQAAKAAGTLNGMTWNQYRSDCSARLKAQPASATTTAAPAAPAAQTANPLNPAPAPAAPAAPATTTASAPAAPSATAPAAPVSGGRAAFLAREKQCGAEWRANKTTLTAQTPGLTWPKYLSQCNARLKSAGK